MSKKVIAKSIEGIETEVSVEDLQFRIGLYAVVCKDGKVLISPQWKENGFDFPGGTLDLGEDHIDGLIREVKEETGFIVKPDKVLGIWTSFFTHPRTKAHYQSMLIYYSAEIVSGEISTNGFNAWELEYAKPAKFVTLDELKTMKWMNTHQEPLQTLMQYIVSKT